MHRIALRRAIIPFIVLALIFGIAAWMIITFKINNKVPSKGVFVYSKEFVTTVV